MKLQEDPVRRFASQCFLVIGGLQAYDGPVSVTEDQKLIYRSIRFSVPDADPKAQIAGRLDFDPNPIHPGSWEPMLVVLIARMSFIHDQGTNPDPLIIVRVIDQFTDISTSKFKNGS